MHRGPCAKCGSKKAFLVDEALQPHQDSSNGVRPQTLTSAYVEKEPRGLFGSGGERKNVTFRARICGGCGFTEIYAKELDWLERFAKSGQGNVRFDDGT